MYRNFVPAEFTSLTKQSWIVQFNHALDLLHLISELKKKVEPGEKRRATAAIEDYTSKLLNILVDDYEYRWINIINLIPFYNIGQISSVIEFLGDIDTEIANKCGGCRQTRISTINKVIDMIKRISWKKRQDHNNLLLEQKEADLKGHLNRQRWFAHLGVQIENAEEEWLEELAEEEWNKDFWYGRIVEWQEHPENRDKMKVTAKEINEYINILMSKSFSQMSNKAVDMKDIKKAQKQIKEARQQYLNEYPAGKKQQKYYDLIVEKLPSLGVLSKKTKKYYDLIVTRSHYIQETEKLETEIRLLKHFARLLEHEQIVRLKEIESKKRPITKKKKKKLR